MQGFVYFFAMPPHWVPGTVLIILKRIFTRGLIFLGDNINTSWLRITLARLLKFRGSVHGKGNGGGWIEGTGIAFGVEFQVCHNTVSGSGVRNLAGDGRFNFRSHLNIRHFRHIGG
jgi:hypothetical protein